MFLLPAAEEEQGKDAAAQLAGENRADQTVEAEEMVEKDHERNIKYQLTDAGVQQSPRAVTHGLHTERGVEICKLER